jgi:hypothetical protein
MPFFVKMNRTGRCRVRSSGFPEPEEQVKGNNIGYYCKNGKEDQEFCITGKECHLLSYSYAPYSI